MREKNSSYQSVSEKKRGALAGVAQSKLITTPHFFSEFSSIDDQSPQLTPEFNGTRRKSQILKIGIQTQTSLGVRGRIYGFSDKAEIQGASGLPQPDVDLTNRGSAVELEIPLLKNGFGRDVGLQKEALVYGSKAEEQLSIFQQRQLEVESQVNYIKAASLYESLSVSRDLINQGERLVRWVQRQARDRLLELVHVAQAESALKARELGLETQLITQESLQRHFWTGIETDGHALPMLVSLEQLEKEILPPKGMGPRLDVAARRHNVNADRAQLALSQEDFKPDLSLKAQYALFEKVRDSDDTSRCSPQGNCDQVAVMATFTLPLDFSNQSQGRKELESKIRSKDLELKRAMIESERDKNVILAQIDKIERQIQVLRELIQSQELRLKEEHERQKRGRATTFDLIQAEQELSESKNQLITSRTLRLELITQLKLYEVTL